MRSEADAYNFKILRLVTLERLLIGFFLLGVFYSVVFFLRQKKEFEMYFPVTYKHSLFETTDDFFEYKKNLVFFNQLLTSPYFVNEFQNSFSAGDKNNVQVMGEVKKEVGEGGETLFFLKISYVEPFVLDSLILKKIEKIINQSVEKYNREVQVQSEENLKKYEMSVKNSLLNHEKDRSELLEKTSHLSGEVFHIVDSLVQKIPATRISEKLFFADKLRDYRILFFENIEGARVQLFSFLKGLEEKRVITAEEFSQYGDSLNNKFVEVISRSEKLKQIEKKHQFEREHLFEIYKTVALGVSFRADEVSLDESGFKSKKNTNKYLLIYQALVRILAFVLIGIVLWWAIIKIQERHNKHEKKEI